MAWVRIDDHFTDHPKAAEAGPLGIAMQVAALCYCNRYLTDGFIPVSVAPRLLDFYGLAEDLDADKVDVQVMGAKINWAWVVDRLENAGMWEPTDGGWMIHDYLEYNPSKADTLAKRAADLERKQRATAPQKRQSTRTKTGTKRESAQNPSGIGADSKRPVPDPVPDPQTSSLRSDEIHPPTPRKREEATAAPPRVSERPRNVLFDALKEACGYDPDATLSSQEATRIGKAAADIKKAGGTVEEIPLRAARYERKYPGAALTPTALSGHWGELASEPAVKANGRASPAEKEARNVESLAGWYMKSEGMDAEDYVRPGDAETIKPLRARVERAEG